LTNINLHQFHPGIMELWNLEHMTIRTWRTPYLVYLFSKLEILDVQCHGICQLINLIKIISSFNCIKVSHMCDGNRLFVNYDYQRILYSAPLF